MREGAFGMDVDYAMLIKLYGAPTDSPDTRYSPAQCIGIRTGILSGNPDRQYISTSYVERQNLNLRMGVRRFILAGREGLFAGEKLYLDLKRLEMAYAENYTREFEITKHVSLRDWFPLALIELRSSGRCQIDIPEALFDLDCAGHSFRRIKSVAVSIPCVVGP
jgi:Tc toxin complex TcA C-terminal TcB-binding domain